MNREQITIDTLITNIKKYNPDTNEQLIRKAYEVAEKAHEGQKRLSGEDYIIHPLSVAQILTTLEIDDESICAALLHDVIEDTSLTYEDVEKEFGTSIADLVDGVTKLGKVQYVTKEEETAENLRKMLLAMAKDIRVIIIKLRRQTSQHENIKI